MEQPHQHRDDVIYFEVAGGKGFLQYGGRSTSVHPPTMELVLFGIEALVHPMTDRLREFYVLPKKDEETSKVPILSPDELQCKTLEGKTIRLTNGKVTLSD